MLELRPSVAQPLQTPGRAGSARTTPRVQVTDRQLIQPACMGVELRQDWNELITGLMGDVIATWDQTGLTQPRLACLPHMLRHCLAQIGRWQRQRRAPALTLQVVQQQQQQQCLGQRAAGGADVPHPPLMVWSEMRPLQEMLMLCIAVWYSMSTVREERVKSSHVEVCLGALGVACLLPVRARLRGPLGMPGSVLALEAALRDARTSTLTRLIHSTLTVTTLVQFSSTSAASVLAQSDDPPVYFAHSMRVLGTALHSVLDRITKGRSRCGGNSSAGSGSSSSSSSSTIGGSIHSQKPDACSPLRQSLQRLRAVLCLGVVRLCNFLLRTDAKRLGELNPLHHSEPVWLAVWEAHDADLAAVVLQMLLLPFRTGKWHSIKKLRNLEPRDWEGQTLALTSDGAPHLGL
ncbi:MAG: hypothetical protein WDW36_006528 [Sanguina aurantia]